MASVDITTNLNGAALNSVIRSPDGPVGQKVEEIAQVSATIADNETVPVWRHDRRGGQNNPRLFNSHRVSAKSVGPKGPEVTLSNVAPHAIYVHEGTDVIFAKARRTKTGRPPSMRFAGYNFAAGETIVTPVVNGQKANKWMNRAVNRALERDPQVKAIARLPED